MCFRVFASGWLSGRNYASKARTKENFNSMGKCGSSQRRKEQSYNVITITSAGKNLGFCLDRVFCFSYPWKYDVKLMMSFVKCSPEPFFFEFNPLSAMISNLFSFEFPISTTQSSLNAKKYLKRVVVFAFSRFFFQISDFLFISLRSNHVMKAKFS